VVVLEVDERIIEFTNKVAKDLNLRLRAQVFDARYALPNDLIRHFDVFACDPVETVEGCKVFISRGVSGLKYAIKLPPPILISSLTHLLIGELGVRCILD